MVSCSSENRRCRRGSVGCSAIGFLWKLLSVGKERLSTEGGSQAHSDENGRSRRIIDENGRLSNLLTSTR